MDRCQLRIITYEVVTRMADSKQLHTETHHDIVEAVKLNAPGVSGRRIWSCLTYIIYVLVRQCETRILWRNRFSLVGVHGKGSKRILEYNPEACNVCEERLECLITDLNPF